MNEEYFRRFLEDALMARLEVGVAPSKPASPAGLKKAYTSSRDWQLAHFADFFLGL